MPSPFLVPTASDSCCSNTKPESNIILLFHPSHILILLLYIINMLLRLLDIVLFAIFLRSRAITCSIRRLETTRILLSCFLCDVGRQFFAVFECIDCILVGGWGRHGAHWRSVFGGGRLRRHDRYFGMQGLLKGSNCAKLETSQRTKYLNAVAIEIQSDLH